MEILKKKLTRKRFLKLAGMSILAIALLPKEVLAKIIVLRTPTTSVTIANIKTAYDHVTDTGASHSFINQALLTNSAVKFGTTEAEGVADPLSVLDQNNATGVFIDFQGTIADTYAATISSCQGDSDVVGPQAPDVEDGWQFYKMIKMKVNGIIHYIAVYSECSACWIAKEIFGSWEHPKTISARFYVNYIAPKWFQKFYLRYGEKIAEFISNKPLFKAILRPLFEIFALEGRREKCKKYTYLWETVRL